MAEQVVAPLRIITHSDVNDFLRSAPTRSDIERLQKSELLLVAHELDLRVESENVFSLVNAICCQLFGECEFIFAFKGNTVSAEAEGGFHTRKNVLEQPVAPSSNDFNEEQAKRDHEFRMLQLQMQVQMQSIQAQERQRERELEIERYRIDKDVPASSPVIPSIALKLVPAFEENQITEFFDRFEKIATGNKWPKDQCSTLAQTAFVRKALKAIDSLSFAQSQNYETLKDAVLRSYEFQPEAYRQRFRNCRKRPHETHSDFCRGLREQFRAWMNSEHVMGD